MATKPFLVAAVQTRSTDDISSNLATCAELAGRAAEIGARIVVLPEDFAFLGRRERDRLAIAETLDRTTPGPILSELAHIAQDHDIWLIGGGMAEKSPDPEEPRAFNTSVVISPTGELVGHYRKLHLFDVDIPGSVRLAESEMTIPGDGAAVITTPIARLGLSICYDLRFPELYRALVDGGAEILLVPAAFTAPTGKAHWHPLLRARAIENQCYVVAANQSGRHNDKRESYGHSQIIDPWGRLMAEVDEGIGIAVAEIDLEELAATRQRMPCLAHRVLR